MGCDTPWLECECVGVERTFYHSNSCKYTVMYKDRKKAEEEMAGRARRAVLSLIASSACHLTNEDIWTFIREYFPSVLISDLHLISLLDPQTLTYNRNHVFRGRTGNFRREDGRD